ncbi:glycerophosphodiester phosphodiesterase [Halobacillus hunanensis]|uniref:glycerophosphodiester phosphodiesterase n=1 Tax=Halobacillus hunanensis TaxID=578214 RepID=UPI0009A5811E|nr:glycerophosphodiester phosphodiesterase family protein [Halobacillus hunanensis]
MPRFLFILIMGVLFMGVFSTSATNVSANEIKNRDRQQTITIAHRGASGYAPENTMAAFEKSVDMKAEMFELDVQMSKDGKLVVIHDTTIDRTTNGSGQVGDFTYEELQQLDAGSWFSEEFASEKIPTLGQVLDEFKGRSGILIELKSPSLYPGIEQKVADALVSRNMHKPENEKIIVQSFDHESMKKFHSILPSVPIGVLLGYSENGVSNEQLAEFSSYADYFNPNKAMITKDLVERIHEYDMKTHPYTVRDRESANFLLEAGVDGIITDFPDYVDPHKG